MVDYNIGIPQQQYFQAPDLMQNAMRMQQMQTQSSQVDSTNRLRAMQMQGLAQDQQLNALKMQAAKQALTDAAAARAQGVSDRNALAGAIKGSVVGDLGPQMPDLTTAANRLAAEGKLGPAATALGAAGAFTAADKSKADLSKINTEVLDKDLATFRTFAPSVRTPEDAGLFAAAMFDHPSIGKLVGRMGLDRDQAIAKAQQDFAADPQRWVASNVGLSAPQVVETLKQKQETKDLGGAVETQTVDAYGRPMGGPTVQAKTAPPERATQPMSAFQENKLRTEVSKDRNSAITSIDAMNDMLAAVSGVRDLSPNQKDTITGLRAKAPALTADGRTATTKLANLKGKVTSLGKQIASVGGAIGAIATQEWQILSNQVASLKTEDMNPKDLEDQLDIIEGQAKRLVTRVRDAYGAQYQELDDKYGGRFALPPEKSRGASGDDRPPLSSFGGR